jgi:hypothetical protein
MMNRDRDTNMKFSNLICENFKDKPRNMSGLSKSGMLCSAPSTLPQKPVTRTA